MTTKRRYSAGLADPKSLAQREGAREVVTFRLGPAAFEALRVLAGEAGVGHATLCRRIIEDYVATHGSREG